MKDGKKYSDKKEYFKAYNSYSKAIKLNHQAYWERASVEIAMDSLEKAIDDIGIFIGVTNDQKTLANAYYQRGIIMDKRGYKSDACDDFKSACDLNLNKACDIYRLKCK